MSTGETPVLLNPRGPSGSGKTQLVRSLMNELLSRPSAAAARMELLYRPGRAQPIACRISHPLGAPPLVVLGHYQKTSGGCDTIREADGGIQQVFTLAEASALAGHSVLMEGSALSCDDVHSSVLAGRYALHVLRLTTPVADCARNLIKRRRLSKDALPDLCKRVLEEQLRINAVCERLRQRGAVVHCLAFSDGMRIARGLLHLPAEPFSGSG
jgi:hypothetical protein